jgi:hypothetical protein
MVSFTNTLNLSTHNWMDPYNFNLIRSFNKLCCTIRIQIYVKGKVGYTLATLPRTVTLYRDSVDWTRDHVTYQKLVTRYRYGHVRCAVGMWPSHQRDDTVTA